jgi:hypothetical protein
MEAPTKRIATILLGERQPLVSVVYASRCPRQHYPCALQINREIAQQ